MNNAQNIKSQNEKRRRDNENVFIEQLAEIVSESCNDMNPNAAKPDKCAILQDAVKLIRVKQKHGGELQLSEVSSSNPNIVSNDVQCPILFEALEGFLVMIGLDGTIEFISSNVNSVLNTSDADLISTSIYDIVHEDDQCLFQDCLSSLPTNGTSSSSSASSGNHWNSSNSAFQPNKDSENSVALEMAGVGAATASLSLSNDSPSTSAPPTNFLFQQQPRSRFFAARFRKRFRFMQRDGNGTMEEGSNEYLSKEELLNSMSEDQTDDLTLSDIDSKMASLSEFSPHDSNDESKPTRFYYERLLVSATWTMLPKISSQSNDALPREWTLFCFARRVPVKDFSPNTLLIDNFSMRFHPNGSIIAIDLSGLPEKYLSYFGKELIGRKWSEICCPTDVHKWESHFSSLTVNSNGSTSEIYRIRPTPSVQLYIQTKSKKLGAECKEIVICNHLIMKNQAFAERVHRERSERSMLLANEHSICFSQQQKSSLPSTDSLSLTSFSSSSLTTTPNAFFQSSSSGEAGKETSTKQLINHTNRNELVSTSSLNSMQQSSSSIFGELSPTGQNLSDYKVNDCLGLNDVFSSNKWPDFDTSTSSIEVKNSSSSRDSTNEKSNTTPNDEHTKTDTKAQKLRNLLTQKSEPGSPMDRKNDEATKAMLDSQLAELTSNRNTLSSSAIEPQSPSNKRSDSMGLGQGEKSRSNDILRELLHQEDEEDVILFKSQAESVQRNFTLDPLANMDTSNSESNHSTNAVTSSNKSALSGMNNSQSGSSNSANSSSGSASSNLSSMSKANGNNMLRKLLNDDDNGKGFRKSQDILIEQLLKENQSPIINSDPPNDNSLKPAGQLKRKSTEDHFTGSGNTSNTNHHGNNSSGSLMGHSSISQPNSSTPENYQPIKRLSLSEPIKSSVPSPVQTRSAPIMTPLSNVNVNSTTISSGFRNVPTNTVSSASLVSNGAHQPQQLAGQNPMLAQMLAQTPKTLPLPTISIPTSIVSQVPQERLPKNLEKKLIHTPTTTSHGSTSTSSISNSNQTPLTFGLTSAISSQSNHVPPSPLIQSSSISVTSQLAPSGSNSFGIVNSISGTQANGPSQQFVMTSGGHIQPVKSIIVQTGPMAHQTGMDMSGQQMVQTQGNFMNEMYISNSTSQSTVPKTSLQMQSSVPLSSGHVITTSQVINSSGGHSMVGTGPSTPNFYSKPPNAMAPLASNNGNSLASSFLTNRVMPTTLSNQRGLAIDENNDPLLSDILEQVCCMEQEMNIDSVPGDSTNNNNCDSVQRDSTSNLRRASHSSINQINSNCTNSSSENRNSNEETSMIMQLFDDVVDETEASKVVSHSNSSNASSGSDMNETLAISEIRKQLMSFDYTGGVPPNQSNQMLANQTMTAQQLRPMYRPPPAYSATSSSIRQMGPTMQNSSSSVANAQIGLLAPAPYPTKVIKHRPQPSNGPPGMPGSPNQPMPSGAVYSPNGMMPQNHMLMSNQQMMVNSPMTGPPPRVSKALIERKQKALYQQMQQKQRLMAQQQQQQMTMQTPQHEPYDPMNEVLLNSQVPPNVTLQAINRPQGNAQTTQMTTQVVNTSSNGPNSIGSFDSVSGSPMSPHFKMISNMLPHSPSPQPTMNAQMMTTQHSPGNNTQRSHSSASNPQGRGFSPSPSLTSPSPHMNVTVNNSIMQTSSPHPYSPASPASGMLPQANSTANPMQPSVASTAVGSPAGNWSPLPPQVLRSNPTTLNQSAMNSNAATQLANRMQQQNPMLNAQLSQGPVGFNPNTTVANSTNNINCGTAPTTPQPPNSPSPSLLSNMRFNRNSPVPNNSNNNNQYPLSPNFHGIHSPTTPPTQPQQVQMNQIPNAQRVLNRNSGFSNAQSDYGSSEYVKQELRARVGARSLQNNNSNGQMQMQTMSGGSLAQPMSQGSNVPQIRPGSATAVSPAGMFNNSSGGMMSSSMVGSQLGSTLTPEDFDAVDLGFDLSEQINATPDSPLFNLGDLTSDSPNMVSSSLNRSNSIGRSNAFGSIDMETSNDQIEIEPNDLMNCTLNASCTTPTVNIATLTSASVLPIEKQILTSSESQNVSSEDHLLNGSAMLSASSQLNSPSVQTFQSQSEQQKRSLLQQLLSEPP